MFCDFKTSTHGKWILCGEHAVVRGGKALVFPLKTKQLHLNFSASNDKLSADFLGDNGDDIHPLFFSVIERGLELVGQSISQLHGHFALNNQIPIGAGMGASAALCVAVSRFLEHQGLLSTGNIYRLAKQLENLFHSESSGLDIAGSANDQGIYFHQDNIQPLMQQWQPQWYLSFSGQIGITSHCVKQVQAGFNENPLRAQAIDKQMADSVEQAKAALLMNKEDGLAPLAKAITLASDCFTQWNLAGGHVKQHIDQLHELGAIAAKPTGSGDGGYVLSLWDKEVPATILQHLIPL